MSGEEEERPVVTVELRGANLDLLKCRATEVAACGRAGTGKTLAACWKMHLTAMKVPNLRGLMLRATHTSLTATTLVTFQRHVALAALADGSVRWFGGSGKDPAGFRYANGSVITVAGGDRPEKFLSAELDRIFVDEAVEISLDLYETLISRLRGQADTYRQIVLATNPSHPQHWIKQRAGDGGLTMITSSHRDNPFYVDRSGSYTEAGREYMGKLDALTGVRRQRLKEGRWTAAEGQIYDEWDDTVHLVDRFDIPADWPRIWGVDFGFTNPFCVQWWAIDPDGRLYLYRELYHTRRTVDEHARTILAAVTEVDEATGARVWLEPKPFAIVADHDAGDRAVLERELTLGTTPARKNVKTGIQAVKARLRPAGDGRPRLYVMRDVLIERDQALAEAKKPLCTADEVSGYVWAKPRASALSKAEPEEPLKVDDHGTDCMRYVVAELDLVGTGSVQSPAAPLKSSPAVRQAAARYGRAVAGKSTQTGRGRR
ncbi:phage terminase large subunit [Streptomyces sp. ME03-5709C]|nr:phage terminase large subunit [Streptomyces sp. ME03-5709C]